MWRDAIVEEIRKGRAEYAAQFNLEKDTAVRM